MPEPLTPAGLARFAEVAASNVADDKVPGLVALVSSHGQVHVEALGTLSLGGPPVQRDSLFRISSTTKPVTGAATLALVDEGLVGLDDPVERWLPELAQPRVLRRMDGPLDDTVPAARPITVRQLLNFTFGFGMTMEMFASSEPWPIVAAAAEAHLATWGRLVPQRHRSLAHGSRRSGRYRCWPSRGSAGFTTPGRRCSASFSRGRLG